MASATTNTDKLDKIIIPSIILKDTPANSNITLNNMKDNLKHEINASDKVIMTKLLELGHKPIDNNNTNPTNNNINTNNNITINNNNNNNNPDHLCSITSRFSNESISPWNANNNIIQLKKSFSSKSLKSSKFKKENRLFELTEQANSMGNNTPFKNQSLNYELDFYNTDEFILLNKDPNSLSKRLGSIDKPKERVRLIKGMNENLCPESFIRFRSDSTSSQKHVSKITCNLDISLKDSLNSQHQHQFVLAYGSPDNVIKVINLQNSLGFFPTHNPKRRKSSPLTKDNLIRYLNNKSSTGKKPRTLTLESLGRKTSSSTSRINSRVKSNIPIEQFEKTKSRDYSTGTTIATGNNTNNNNNNNNNSSVVSRPNSPKKDDEENNNHNKSQIFFGKNRPKYCQSLTSSIILANNRKAFMGISVVDYDPAKDKKHKYLKTQKIINDIPSNDKPALSRIDLRAGSASELPLTYNQLLSQSPDFQEIKQPLIQLKEISNSNTSSSSNSNHRATQTDSLISNTNNNNTSGLAPNYTLRMASKLIEKQESKGILDQEKYILKKIDPIEMPSSCMNPLKKKIPSLLDQLQKTYLKKDMYYPLTKK